MGNGRKKRLLFWLLSGMLVLGSGELLLRLAAMVSHRADQLLGPLQPSAAIPDERLGNRPNPRYPGHDRLGFRNKRVPRTAEIVALGDSQTYGTGVKSREAWPRQLATMTGKSVYSMAFGGYGPTHSLLLWDEAMSLSPKTVIATLYTGNDLYDSYNHVYIEGALPELKSADPALQTAIRVEREQEPLSDKIGRLFRMGGREKLPEKRTERDSALGSTALRLLEEHSRLYGLLRRASHELRGRVGATTVRQADPAAEWEMMQALAMVRPGYLQLLDNGTFRTACATRYRLAALELEDPRIFEGLQISLRALQQMSLKAKGSGIRFLVLLIPTKVRVFQPFWENPPAGVQLLIGHGDETWQIATKFFRDNGIDYLDSLPVLRGQLQAGIQPYPVTQDGHPNRQGHHAIAALVADRVR